MRAKARDKASCSTRGGAVAGHAPAAVITYNTAPSGLSAEPWDRSPAREGRRPRQQWCSGPARSQLQRWHRTAPSVAVCAVGGSNGGADTGESGGEQGDAARIWTRTHSASSPAGKPAGDLQLRFLDQHKQFLARLGGPSVPKTSTRSTVVDATNGSDAGGLPDSSSAANTGTQHQSAVLGHLEALTLLMQRLHKARALQAAPPDDLVLPDALHLLLLGVPADQQPQPGVQVAGSTAEASTARRDRGSGASAQGTPTDPTAQFLYAHALLHAHVSGGSGASTPDYSDLPPPIRAAIDSLPLSAAHQAALTAPPAHVFKPLFCKAIQMAELMLSGADTGLPTGLSSLSGIPLGGSTLRLRRGTSPGLLGRRARSSSPPPSPGQRLQPSPTRGRGRSSSPRPALPERASWGPRAGSGAGSWLDTDQRGLEDIATPAIMHRSMYRLVRFALHNPLRLGITPEQCEPAFGVVAWAVAVAGTAMARHLAAVDPSKASSVQAALTVLRDIEAGADVLADFERRLWEQEYRLGGAQGPVGWGAALRAHVLSQQLDILLQRQEAAAPAGRGTKGVMKQIASTAAALESALRTLMQSSAGAGMRVARGHEQYSVAHAPRHALTLADGWHRLGAARAVSGQHAAAVVCFGQALEAYQILERGTVDNLQEFHNGQDYAVFSALACDARAFSAAHGTASVAGTVWLHRDQVRCGAALIRSHLAALQEAAVPAAGPCEQVAPPASPAPGDAGSPPPAGEVAAGATMHSAVNAQPGAGSGSGSPAPAVTAAAAHAGVLCSAGPQQATNAVLAAFCQQRTAHDYLVVLQSQAHSTPPPPPASPPTPSSGPAGGPVSAGVSGAPQLGARDGAGTAPASTPGDGTAGASAALPPNTADGGTGADGGDMGEATEQDVRMLWAAQTLLRSPTSAPLQRACLTILQASYMAEQVWKLSLVRAATTQHRRRRAPRTPLTTPDDVHAPAGSAAARSAPLAFLHTAGGTPAVPGGSDNSRAGDAGGWMLHVLDVQGVGVTSPLVARSYVDWYKRQVKILTDQFKKRMAARCGQLNRAIAGVGDEAYVWCHQHHPSVCPATPGSSRGAPQDTSSPGPPNAGVHTVVAAPAATLSGARLDDVQLPAPGGSAAVQPTTAAGPPGPDAWADLQHQCRLLLRLWQERPAGVVAEARQQAWLLLAAGLLDPPPQPSGEDPLPTPLQPPLVMGHASGPGVAVPVQPPAQVTVRRPSPRAGRGGSQSTSPGPEPGTPTKAPHRTGAGGSGMPAVPDRTHDGPVQPAASTGAAANGPMLQRSARRRSGSPSAGRESSPPARTAATASTPGSAAGAAQGPQVLTAALLACGTARGTPLRLQAVHMVSVQLSSTYLPQAPLNPPAATLVNWLLNITPWYARVVAGMLPRKGNLGGLLAEHVSQAAPGIATPSSPRAPADAAATDPAAAPPAGAGATAVHAGVAAQQPAPSSRAMWAQQQQLISGVLTLAVQRRLMTAVLSSRVRPTLLNLLLGSALPVDLKMSTISWLASRNTPAAVYLGSVGLRDLVARFLDGAAGDVARQAAHSSTESSTQLSDAVQGTPSTPGAVHVLARPTAAHLVAVTRRLAHAALSLPQQHAATALACARLLVPALTNAPDKHGTVAALSQGLFQDVAIMLMQTGPHPYLCCDLARALVTAGNPAAVPISLQLAQHCARVRLEHALSELLNSVLTVTNTATSAPPSATSAPAGLPPGLLSPDDTPAAHGAAVSNAAGARGASVITQQLLDALVLECLGVRPGPSPVPTPRISGIPAAPTDPISSPAAPPGSTSTSAGGAGNANAAPWVVAERTWLAVRVAAVVRDAHRQGVYTLGDAALTALVNGLAASAGTGTPGDAQRDSIMSATMWAVGVDVVGQLERHLVLGSPAHVLLKGMGLPQQALVLDRLCQVSPSLALHCLALVLEEAGAQRITTTAGPGAPSAAAGPNTASGVAAEARAAAPPAPGASRGPPAGQPQPLGPHTDLQQHTQHVCTLRHGHAALALIRELVSSPEPRWWCAAPVLVNLHRVYQSAVKVAQQLRQAQIDLHDPAAPAPTAPADGVGKAAGAPTRRGVGRGASDAKHAPRGEDGASEWTKEPLLPALSASEMAKIVLCYAVLGSSPGDLQPGPPRHAAAGGTPLPPPAPRRVWQDQDLSVGDVLGADGVLPPPLSPAVMANQALHLVTKYFTRPVDKTGTAPHSGSGSARTDAPGSSSLATITNTGGSSSNSSGGAGAGEAAPLITVFPPPRHAAADALYDLLEEVIRSRLDTHPALHTLLQVVCTSAIRAACAAPGGVDRPLLLKALVVATNSEQLPFVARLLSPSEVLRAASAAVQARRSGATRLLLKHLAGQHGLRSEGVLAPALAEFINALAMTVSSSATVNNSATSAPTITVSPVPSASEAHPPPAHNRPVMGPAEPPSDPLTDVWLHSNLGGCESIVCGMLVRLSRDSTVDLSRALTAGAKRLAIRLCVSQGAHNSAFRLWAVWQQRHSVGDLGRAAACWLLVACAEVGEWTIGEQLLRLLGSDLLPLPARGGGTWDTGRPAPRGLSGSSLPPRSQLQGSLLSRWLASRVMAAWLRVLAEVGGAMTGPMPPPAPRAISGPDSTTPPTRVSRAGVGFMPPAASTRATSATVRLNPRAARTGPLSSVSPHALSRPLSLPPPPPVGAFPFTPILPPAGLAAAAAGGPARKKRSNAASGEEGNLDMLNAMVRGEVVTEHAPMEGAAVLQQLKKLPAVLVELAKSTADLASTAPVSPPVPPPDAAQPPAPARGKRGDGTRAAKGAKRQPAATAPLTPDVPRGSAAGAAVVSLHPSHPLISGLVVLEFLLLNLLRQERTWQEKHAVQVARIYGTLHQVLATVSACLLRVEGQPAMGLLVTDTRRVLLRVTRLLPPLDPPPSPSAAAKALPAAPLAAAQEQADVLVASGRAHKARGKQFAAPEGTGTAGEVSEQAGVRSGAKKGSGRKRGRVAKVQPGGLSSPR